MAMMGWPGALTHVREWLLEHPAVYSAWQAPFVAQKFAPVEREIRHHDIRRVLDVGCGPGTNAARFAGADYVGVDVNERYLAIARTRHRGRFIQADLMTADLSALGVFDTILVNSFLHHLPDASVERVLAQLGRRLDEDGKVHMLELVLPDRKSPAWVMAKLDRGKYPRSLERWRELFTAYFDPVMAVPYSFGGPLWSMIYFQGRGKTCASR
jgi:SAM-dependent methyltransferase